MTEYELWMREQPEEFQREILGSKEIEPEFKDNNFRSVSLKQLRELDDKYN
jgi:hypothetical protein